MSNKRMLENIRRKIESMMYAPKDQEDQGALELVLYGISKIYCGAQVLRREAYRRGVRRTYRLPCKVVSVGNLVVGGTGKTPMTAYLALALQQMGQRVVVISRGYKGGAGQGSHVVSDGQQVLMDTAYSGDEAQLLAHQLKNIPVLIGRDRYQAGMDAVTQFQPDVIVLDDGFQHIRLHRDLNLMLLDATAPLGNHYVLPRGLLREPAAALRAADGIVFTRTVPGDGVAKENLDFVPSQVPAFHSAHKPYLIEADNSGRVSHAADMAKEVRCELNRLDGARVAAFSGIARNEEFQRTLKDHGADLAGVNAFSDHHSYEQSELRKIAAEARDSGADFLVTTEKDFARLPRDFQWPLDLMVVGVEIDFGEQEPAFLEFLRSGFDL